MRGGSIHAYISVIIYQANTCVVGIPTPGNRCCLSFRFLWWYRNNNDTHSGSDDATHFGSHSDNAAQPEPDLKLDSYHGEDR